MLVIITDRQRADHVGFTGNTTVKTPHLDALASRSMVFDRAYVADPVCSPNRTTLLTGRMPSSHGVIFNDRALDSWTEYGPELDQASIKATWAQGTGGVTKTVDENSYYKDKPNLYLKLIGAVQN